MSVTGSQPANSLLKPGKIGAVDRVARMMIAAHVSGSNLLVCGTEADRVATSLREVGLERVLTMESGAVAIFGEPGDVVVVASESPNPSSLLSVASSARNSGLRRVGFLPDNTGENDGVLEVVLRPADLRHVSQALHRLMRPEETIVLALGETEEPRQGSEWALRSLRSRGLTVVEIPGEEVSRWRSGITDLRQSAELRGVDLARSRVVSDLPMVLDAAAAAGATPQTATNASGPAGVAREILMQYASYPAASPGGSQDPQSARRNYR